MTLKLVLILCFLSTCHSLWHFAAYVHFEFNLKCEIPGPWCAEVYVFERDIASSDDPWLYGRICTNETEGWMETPLLYPGEDEAWTNHFDIGVTIYHNCTSAIHLPTYNCKYNQQIFNCPAKMQLKTPSQHGYKCGCSSSTHNDVPALDKGTLVIVNHTLTNSVANAYETFYKDQCEFPHAFQQLGDRFKHIRPPCAWDETDKPRNWDFDKFVNYAYVGRSFKALNRTLIN